MMFLVLKLDVIGIEPITIIIMKFKMRLLLANKDKIKTNH